MLPFKVTFIKKAALEVLLRFTVSSAAIFAFTAIATHDCLIAALRGYVEDRLPTRRPSPIVGQPFVTLDALESAKLALAQAVFDEKMSNVALARRLGVTEAVVRRLLDLDQRSHIGQVEKALGILGRRLEVRVKAA